MNEIIFPPLGNSEILRVASADLAKADLFSAFVTSVDDAASADGELDRLPAEHWLAAAVRTANDAAARFELVDLHSARRPRVLDLPSDTDRLDGMALTTSTSRAKLRVLLGLSGEGSVGLSFAGVAATATITVGTLLVLPAFLVVKTGSEDGELRILDVVASGPAFR